MVKASTAPLKLELDTSDATALRRVLESFRQSLHANEGTVILWLLELDTAIRVDAVNLVVDIRPFPGSRCRCKDAARSQSTTHKCIACPPERPCNDRTPGMLLLLGDQMIEPSSLSAFVIGKSHRRCAAVSSPRLHLTAVLINPHYITIQIEIDQVPYAQAQAVR